MLFNLWHCVFRVALVTNAVLLASSSVYAGFVYRTVSRIDSNRLLVSLNCSMLTTTRGAVIIREALPQGWRFVSDSATNATVQSSDDRSALALASVPAFNQEDSSIIQYEIIMVDGGDPASVSFSGISKQITGHEASFTAIAGEQEYTFIQDAVFGTNLIHMKIGLNNAGVSGSGVVVEGEISPSNVGVPSDAAWQQEVLLERAIDLGGGDDWLVVATNRFVDGRLVVPILLDADHASGFYRVTSKGHSQ